MLAIFVTNQDISLAKINIKFTKCSYNTVAILYNKQVVVLFFECSARALNKVKKHCGMLHRMKV